jgi:hypothetical protein
MREVLPEHKRIFEFLQDVLWFFCVGDETGIFYHIQHRPVKDIYLFMPYENMKDFLKFLKRIDFISKDTAFFRIGDTDVFFFSYPFPILEDAPVLCYVEGSFGEIPIRVLSLRDILCMKIISIFRKANAKDFCDAYFVIKYLGLSKDKILNLIERKYGEDEKNFLARSKIPDVSISEGDFQKFGKGVSGKVSLEDIKSFFKNLWR